MNNKDVDLVVIGAGATGANVAYEAIQRGLKTVLIDSSDIGSGTSCRSTKLLHGGVRYLELAFKTFNIAQLNLVREALIERSHWLMQAPFLAKPIELILPTNNCFEKAYFRMGLGLYDALSGNRGIGKSKLISPNQLQAIIPRLSEFSNGGITYSDGQFDDARLNLLIALTAERAGVIIRTHCKVVGFERNNYGNLNAVISQDSFGKQERWSTKVIVNACGINADEIRSMVDSNTASRIITSRGVHGVLQENLCPKQTGLLIPSTADGRVLFVLPFFNRTLIGTTDTPCKINQAKQASQEEKEYLKQYIKRLFPDLIEPMFTSCWAGGRPLLKPSSEKVNTSRVTREHEIETLPCGLISAMGGKWTTCRRIAIDTLKAIESYIGYKLPTTTSISIIGADKDSALTKSLLLKQKLSLSEYLPKSKHLNAQIFHLQKTYGLEALDLIANSDKDSLSPLSEIVPICQAEINHFIKKEHAKKPTDILSRRCRLAMIDIKEAKKLMPIIQDTLVKEGLPPGELDLEK